MESCSAVGQFVMSSFVVLPVMVPLLSSSPSSSSNGLRTSGEDNNDFPLYFGAGCWLMGGWLGVIAFAIGKAPETHKKTIWYGSVIAVVAIIVFIICSLPNSKEAYGGLGLALLISGLCAITAAQISKILTNQGGIFKGAKLIDPETPLFWLSLIDTIFSTLDIIITIFGKINEEVNKISEEDLYVWITFFIGIGSLALGTITLSVTTEGRGENGNKSLKTGRIIAYSTGIACIIMGLILIWYSQSFT